MNDNIVHLNEPAPIYAPEPEMRRWVVLRKLAKAAYVMLLAYIIMCGLVFNAVILVFP